MENTRYIRGELAGCAANLVGDKNGGNGLTLRRNIARPIVRREAPCALSMVPTVCRVMCVLGGIIYYGAPDPVPLLRRARYSG